MKTTANFYVGLQSRSAGRHCNAVVLNLRKRIDEARPPARRKRKYKAEAA